MHYLCRRNHARMAESVDALVSNTSGETGPGIYIEVRGSRSSKVIVK